MKLGDPLRARLIGTLWVIVPIWFVVISVIRLSTYVPYEPGYDGMLYRTATVSWMHGLDPWAAPVEGAAFAAPPPTLLAMVPFALVPEPVARVALLVLGVVVSVWMIRRLKLPIWWLAFPPLVDGLYIGNPHIFIAPLLVAGLAPIAGFLKLYALAVPALRLDVRALVITGVLLLVTIPLLPWGQFIADWPQINDALRRQAGGTGLSVWATPWLLPVAVAAAVLIGRERLAWLSVPVFWPFTQWYYAAMALPGVTPLAAMAFATPVAGATTVALVIAVAELYWRGRSTGRSELLRWPPRPGARPGATPGPRPWPTPDPRPATDLDPAAEPPLAPPPGSGDRASD
jgi:hypothetical protein